MFVILSYVFIGLCKTVATALKAIYLTMLYLLKGFMWVLFVLPVKLIGSLFKN